MLALSGCLERYDLLDAGFSKLGPAKMLARYDIIRSIFFRRAILAP